jgi:hypothetical protein
MRRRVIARIDSGVLNLAHEPDARASLAPDGASSPGHGCSGEHGAVRERFRVTPREVTEVRHYRALTVRLRVIGPPLQQSAVAPQRLEFALPRPVLVVVRNGDATVAGAIVEVDGGPKLRTDRRGELRVVPTGTVRLRATHERLRSAWHEVGPGDARTTIELTLAADLVEVAIEFDGDFRVRNTTVQWRRDDGVEGREHLLRDDRPGAFRVFLDPGRTG